mmetsp:Transcript_16593/g.24518  ORF Transcript_16593/g.24518 Transcript_16593/m.24518 type:complete len:110 (+) Transcript_16593:770-1099(+)
MLRPFFAAIIISQMVLRLYGSRPAVGSSKKTTSGFPISAIAMRTFLFIPPENVPSGLSASSSDVNLTSSRRRLTSASTAAATVILLACIGMHPFKCAKRLIYSLAVKSS